MSGDEGGPAFPVQSDSQMHPSYGMSMRDYFAAQVAGAVHQTVCDGTHRPPDGSAGAGFIAATSYEIADAMLKERLK